MKLLITKKKVDNFIKMIILKKITIFIRLLNFSKHIFALTKFNNLLTMLSRKAEGLDPLKP